MIQHPLPLSQEALTASILGFPGAPTSVASAYICFASAEAPSPVFTPEEGPWVQFSRDTSIVGFN